MEINADEVESVRKRDRHRDHVFEAIWKLWQMIRLRVLDPRWASSPIRRAQRLCVPCKATIIHLKEPNLTLKAPELVVGWDLTIATLPQFFNYKSKGQLIVVPATEVFE